MHMYIYISKKCSLQLWYEHLGINGQEFTIPKSALFAVTFWKLELSCLEFDIEKVVLYLVILANSKHCKIRWCSNQAPNDAQLVAVLPSFQFAWTVASCRFTKSFWVWWTNIRWYFGFQSLRKLNLGTLRIIRIYPCMANCYSWTSFSLQNIFPKT